MSILPEPEIQPDDPVDTEWARSQRATTPSDLTWHVIKKMRELRSLRGYSALELERRMAAEAGVIMTRAVIANMEVGRRRDVTVDQLVGLAKVFKTDVEYLLGIGGFFCTQCRGDVPTGFACLACGTQGAE